MVLQRSCLDPQAVLSARVLLCSGAALVRGTGTLFQAELTKGAKIVCTSPAFELEVTAVLSDVEVAVKCGAWPPSI